MIDLVIPARALVSLVSLAAVAFVVYGPWQWVCTDLARQFIFEARDKVFDLAADGKLSYDSREYRTIRSSLQSMIRFAHELTLWRFIILAAAMTKTGLSTRKSGLQFALEAIEDEATRAEVRQIVLRAQVAAAMMMVAKSPIFVLLVLPLAVIVAPIFALIKKVRSCFAYAATFTGNLIQVEAEAAA